MNKVKRTHTILETEYVWWGFTRIKFYLRATIVQNKFQLFLSVNFITIYLILKETNKCGSHVIYTEVILSQSQVFCRFKI